MTTSSEGDTDDRTRGKSGIAEADPSFLVRDEILADHLRNIPVKRNGELVFFDAFDLAVAEHRMMHSIASRELRSRSNSEGFFDRLLFVVNRRFFLRLSSWLGSDHGTIDQWLSPRGRAGTITEKWGAVARLVLNLINAVPGRRSRYWAGVELRLDNLRPYAVGYFSSVRYIVANMHIDCHHVSLSHKVEWLVAGGAGP